MNKKADLAVMPTSDVAEQLQEVVLSVTGAEGLVGFKRAYLMASGIKQLKEILTAEFMAPIMELQGSKLGFRTDKDRNKDGTKGPGYPMDVVRDCVIEATLSGLQVTGNQFNIIAANMYPTKEGCGYKLNNFPGLKHQIICGLPRLSNDGTSAAVELTIKWTLHGETNQEIVPKPIRVNASMGLDAIIGKAERKGRAWLLSRITGCEITDGEVEDATATIVSSKSLKSKEQENTEVEAQRWLALFKDANNVEELEFYATNIPEELLPAYNTRLIELQAKLKK